MGDWRPKLDPRLMERVAALRGASPSVFLILATHADKDSGEAFPSIDTIAKRIRRQRRAVEKGITTLEEAGVIAKTKQPGRATTYRLGCDENGLTLLAGCDENAATLATKTPHTCDENDGGDATKTPHITSPENKPREQAHLNKPKRGRAAEVVFPSELDSDVFRAAWGRWAAHRNEKRKPLTPTSTTAQLKELAEWGQVRAIAAIDRSIKAGWTGIFEETKSGTNGHARKTGFPCGPGQRHTGTAGKIGVF